MAGMQFGAGLPITAMDDPGAIREYVQALEDSGFDVLTTAGHLLAVPAGRHPDRPTPLYAGPFHDPFVVFAYLAAITSRIRFRPSLLILPLYPTAIVAKQAAELQQLSRGRFELGVGLSWNAAEYAAVGQDFTTRGRRVEEQIEVLRRLWSEPYVTFTGSWHTLDGVGQAHLREAGRDPSTFGIAVRLAVGTGGPEEWIAEAQKLQAMGVTQLGLWTPELRGEAALRRLIEARGVLAEALPGQASEHRNRVGSA
jgi:alkanesulfonate monooxygenase SsuD/methylene tetrahydromethanopterin reductase-like flavin-dependent oxidoreductase (luciferase family)